MNVRSTRRRNISSGATFEAEYGYSRAVVTGDWIFVSGTTGFDYRTMTISADVSTQCRQALDNIGEALAAAGAHFGDVVRVHYLLPDAADFSACAPLLCERFGAQPPAATMMVVGLLDPRMKIEIEVTARRTAVTGSDANRAAMQRHEPDVGSLGSDRSRLVRPASRDHVVVVENEIRTERSAPLN